MVDGARYRRVANRLVCILVSGADTCPARIEGECELALTPATASNNLGRRIFISSKKQCTGLDNEMLIEGRISAA